MKKEKVRYQFAIKSKEELDNLSYEELIEYTKNLTDKWHKKNSVNFKNNVSNRYLRKIM